MALSQYFAHLSVNDPDASIEDVNLPLVSPERDTRTDEDHKALDAKISKAFRSDRRNNEEPDLPSLFFNMSNADKSLKSFTPEEAEDLLQSQPLIKTVFRNAWRKAAFKDVRQLGMLLVTIPTSRPLISPPASRNSLAPGR